MRFLFNLSLLLLSCSLFAQEERLNYSSSLLSEAWQFREAASGDAWFAVPMPISAHTALMKQGKIKDPFLGKNETKAQWVETKDWEFQTTFNASAVTLASGHIELRFAGLDTYAQVFLNDSLLLESDNMFRSYTVDVKNRLKKGENTLRIFFESPVKKVEKEWAGMGYELPGGSRTLTRKAQFHYGWDWSPRMVGCGILEAPQLITWDNFVIDDLHFYVNEYTPEMARLAAVFTYRSDVAGKAQVFTRSNGGKDIQERMLIKGVNTDSVVFEIFNPELWWTHDLGTPYLYDITLQISMGGKTLETIKQKTGIRWIELVQEPDAAGRSFYFKLNGTPIFAKGANYIPQDVFQDRVSEKNYEKLLSDAKAANMNMLRVWGGGIYENELFYDKCDEKGILVWQDFMYACAMYPGSGSFLKNAGAEALEQVKRLRKHTSLALWCGNNEVAEAWANWGWQAKLKEENKIQMAKDYKTLFVDLLPAYVETFGAGVPYHESSPTFGRGDKRFRKEGDAHDWGVWHDEMPFSALENRVPRFMSEFGFQSFPNWRSIEAFTEPAERNLLSETMLLHQKHPKGNQLIETYMKRDYAKPDNFKDFTYISQLLQAEGMRTGIEAQRRAKPYCMGTLYWQLNDLWPVASWSGIDYLGRWKALHYYAREAYAPIAALPLQDEDGNLSLTLVSDKLKAETVSVLIQAFDFSGKKLADVQLPNIEARVDSGRVIWRGSVRDLVGKRQDRSSFAKITVTNAYGSLLYTRILYFVAAKDLRLPTAKIKKAIVSMGKGYEITLNSDNLAKNVQILAPEYGQLSDNYFDLLPGEAKTILFRTNRLLEDVDSAFEFSSLVDTF